MEPLAAPPNHGPARNYESFPLVSPNKFLALCLLSLGLYGLWWQYKTWRFFKQWKQTDNWPALRAIFSLFTFHGLLQHINEFAYETSGTTPLPNTTGLAAGYIILNLLARLPEPLWLIALGASGFLLPPFRAFRNAMLAAPEYGGIDQVRFSTRQIVALVVGAILWALLIFGLTLPD
ncbi:MAG: hypothetical protein M3Y12_07205 [Bacteroidota bacterium]|nr:hypothetical protein [Bacteroidota bacterium]